MADFISVQRQDFSQDEQCLLLRQHDENVGGLCSFVGTVRGGAECSAMSLEHYPGMTEKSLASIVADAHLRWSLQAVRIIHRVGKLLPGEQIVFVGVATRHRGDAFTACEYIMDHLKTNAPFWKKEFTEQGERWVDAREIDSAALERWL